MSSFTVDDETQRKLRDRYLVPYYRGVYRDRFVLLDGGTWARRAQIGHVAGDTVAQDRKTGEAVMIEEKIMKVPDVPGHFFPNIAFETTAPGGRGWAHYLQADLLAYGFEATADWLDVYFMDWRPLKVWFWQNVGDFEEKDIDDGRDFAGNARTFKIRLAPIAKCARATRSWRRLLFPDGTHQKLDVSTDRRDLRRFQAGVAAE